MEDHMNDDASGSGGFRMTRRRAVIQGSKGKRTLRPITLPTLRFMSDNPPADGGPRTQKTPPRSRGSKRKL